MNRSIKIAFVVTVVAAMSFVMLRGIFAWPTGAQPASAGGRLFLGTASGVRTCQRREPRDRGLLGRNREGPEL